MAQDRPTAAELLGAIADFLREEATPVLDRAEPRLGFQMRVAVNSLAILEREARLGPAADAREHERLAKLLGRDGTLEELNRELAQQLRTGQRDERDAGADGPSRRHHRRQDCHRQSQVEVMMPATFFADRSEAGRLLAAELAHSPIAARRVRPAALRRSRRLRDRPASRRPARCRAGAHGARARRSQPLLATVLEGDPPEVRIEPDWDRSPAVSRAWLDAEVSEALREVDRRRRHYRDGSRPVSPAGRVAIVVDQAIGPGHAMAGAIRLIRDARPSMIVAAAPVAAAPAPSVSPARPTRWSACAARPSSARSSAIMARPGRSPTKKRSTAWRAPHRHAAMILRPAAELLTMADGRPGLNSRS